MEPAQKPALLPTNQRVTLFAVSVALGSSRWMKLCVGSTAPTAVYTLVLASSIATSEP